MKKSSETESLILQAAERVFYLRGFDGARMQEIADAASINKALLHYYFRSKQRLFDAVFTVALSRLVPPVLAELRQNLPLEEKITRFVNTYFATVRKNPALPGFIVHEMQRNPGHFGSVIRQQRIDVLYSLCVQLEEEARSGRLRSISPEQFLLNLFSLCAFPLIAAVGMQALSGMNSDAYEELLEERRKLIPRWMLDMLRPQNR